MLMVLVTVTAVAQGPATNSIAPQITGRVLDENGKPIAGAAVGVFAWRAFVDTAKLLAKPLARTAADGTYEVSCDPKHRLGALAIAATGRQSCTLQISEDFVSGGGSFGDTVLMPGVTLAGRVRDESGAPLVGARLRVDSAIADYHDAFRLEAGATSDGDGIFTVPCVPRTGLLLVAEADGYLTETRLVAHESPTDLSLRKVGMVRGKVVDVGGTPLAGVLVTAVTVENRYVVQPVFSAADGTFAVTVPNQGRFRVVAYEKTPPHRSLTSGLLHGPADDVVVAGHPAAPKPSRTIEVTVVAGGTKQPIEEFRLSQHAHWYTNRQMVLLGHHRARKTYTGKARLELTQPEPGTLAEPFVVVDAPGHGFRIARIPDELDRPLQVELDHEAILSGRVVDAENGKPMSGVAVRVLPRGTSHGTIGRAEDAGPLSDAEGNYRVAGLAPGDYGVQVHAATRPASPVVPVTLHHGVDNHLDLTVPKQRWLEVELKGTLPDGLPCRLSVGREKVYVGRVADGFFSHQLPTPAALDAPRAGTFRLGPVGDGLISLELFVPSRTRAGTGTTIRFGPFDPDEGVAAITLPELTASITKGRVHLPPGVPSERIGVLATAVEKARSWHRPTDPLTVAGIEADGRFAIDLPAGPYHLQLVDLQTGIVFHTEPEDYRAGERDAPLTVRPAIHWLEIECAPRRAGGEVVLQSIYVRLQRPRAGACAAFRRLALRDDDTEACYVDCPMGGSRLRWLVPAGTIEIEPNQALEELQPLPKDYRGEPTETVRIEIEKAEHKAVLTIPPPPWDEDLRRGR